MESQCSLADLGLDCGDLLTHCGWLSASPVPRGWPGWAQQGMSGLCCYGGPPLRPTCPPRLHVQEKENMNTHANTHVQP